MFASIHYFCIKASYKQWNSFQSQVLAIFAPINSLLESQNWRRPLQVCVSGQWRFIYQLLHVREGTNCADSVKLFLLLFARWKTELGCASSQDCTDSIEDSKFKACIFGDSLIQSNSRKSFWNTRLRAFNKQVSADWLGSPLNSD